MITIDWDNYEITEATDYTLEDLEIAIELVREEMDYFIARDRAIPGQLEELLVTLTNLEEEMEND